MTSVDKKTLRTILYLCKFSGIINISYTLDLDGILIQSTASIYKCLEITRIFILMIFTYSIHIKYFFNEKIFLFKIWFIIIASRISETRVIQLMNGIVEYDQKLSSLPSFLIIHKHSPKKSYWNIIFIFTLIYYIAITIIFIILWLPTTIEITTITDYFIRIEFIMDVAVMFSSYFFLQQLEHRFQTLNDSWEYLLPGFLAVPGELTHSITGMALDKIRLLHAELSDLLKIFSVGYGQILLGFFVFNYINMLLCFYYTIQFDFMIREEFNFLNFLRNLIPHIFNLQSVILILAIIIAASRVQEKKQKMISHLRSIRISKLSTNLKTQVNKIIIPVKLFMNQISVFESSEITASGIFNINLNLVVSILVLLITGLVTLIQMKNHPILMQSKENLKTFMQKLYNVTSN